ncbi:MAG: hypothetical protein FJ146_15835 [Deltaproteobacteria bacterium]|nr:hypothetical protein [Deltaproteobacteria bacterium]
MNQVVVLIAMGALATACSEKAANKDLRSPKAPSTAVGRQPGSGNVGGQATTPQPTPVVQQPAQPSPPSPTTDNRSQPPLALDGNWATTCQSDPETGSSETNTATYQGTRFTFNVLFYNDDKCADLRQTFTVESTYKLGKPSIKVEGAYEADYIVTKVTLTPAADAIAAVMTENFKTANVAACVGYEFKADVPTDVTKCGLFPAALFDIVKVNGKQMQQGNCNAEGACETVERRARAVDEMVYTKVESK